jgi:hypothetical protein
MKELKTEPLLEFIDNQRQNLRDHVNRMDRRRIPKQILQYAPCGRGSIGRPVKRWLKTITYHMI